MLIRELFNSSQYIPVKNTLIHSEASACFIDAEIVKQNDIPTRKKQHASIVRVIVASATRRHNMVRTGAGKDVRDALSP